jgi:hypothetical protein
VDPKPPFAQELTLEREMEEFARLARRLAGWWSLVFPRDDQPYTSVIVPSLTLDRSQLARVKGATFYEERLLFFLIRLRNPYARMVYVTSQPIHPAVIDYYLQLLTGIPGSHARRRLTLVCAYDASPRPLTEKILERPRLIQRIRSGILDPERAYLTVFNSTPLERRLAVLLGIPSNGVDPSLVHLGTKSGSRRIFREAGVLLPDGAEDLGSSREVEEALHDLQRRRPGLRRAVVKLNEGFSGEGNAIVSCPPSASRPALRDALRGAQLANPSQTWEELAADLSRKGAVVEELIEGPGCTSPSVQLRINPLGHTSLSSSHEQVLEGPAGQLYRGCRFPANDAYRPALQQAGLSVGRVLAKHGVVSRLSVDFLARPRPQGGTDLFALEINLRMGGTTHPMLALRFLTNGRLDEDCGLFRSQSGIAKYYRATDNLQSDAYTGLLPEDVVEIATLHRLHYDYRSETGVLFHMMGGISEFGRVGMIAIGNSPAEAEELYARAVDVLGRESRTG